MSGVGFLLKPVETEARSADEGLPLPSILVSCMLLLIVAVLVCLGTELFCRAVLHLTAARYTWPLRLEAVRFPDLLSFYPRFRYLHSEQFFTMSGIPQMMYPAPMAVVLSLLYVFAPHEVAAYMLFAGVALGVAALLFTRALRRQHVRWSSAAVFTGACLVLSYPVWFALGQANLEIVLWAILAAGIALFFQGRTYAAAICFGLAASLKLYPALFLLLLLARKQYLQCAVGVLVGAACSVSSLFFVGPTFASAYRGIARNLNLFRQLYMLRFRDESGIDHSLFNFFKLLVHRQSGHDAWMSPRLTAYLASMTLATITLALWKVRRLPVVNQVLFCTVVCVLFPPTSFEYTLLQVLTMFGLLALVAARAEREHVRVPGLQAALLLCAALEVFLPELIYRGVQLDGPVKCLLLVALLAICLRFPLGTCSRTAEAEVGSRIGRRAVPPI